MSNSNSRWQAVDDAIDRAVREMMQVDARPGLRRRVLSRIEHRSSGPWIPGSAGPGLLVPAGVLAAVVLAVVLWRPADKPAEVAQIPLASAPVAPSAPSAPSALSEAKGARVRSESIFGPRRDRVSAASLDRAATPASSLVPFIVEDVPSRVAPIVINPLPQVNEIRIAPIEVQRITLPGLSPPR